MVEVGAKEVSFYTSITVDQNDHPSMTFYEYFGATGENLLRLRDVTLNGKYWALRTVDGAPGSGKFNSLATDSAGNPAVAYGNVKYENASLRFAHWNGRSWDRQIIEGEGQPGTSMWSVRLLMDQDQPHIAYTDVDKKLVKYATRVNGKWETEVVDTLAREGYPDRNGIALDDQGNPYISYFDAGVGVLKVAHREDHRWVAEVVDRSFAGFTNSMQIRNGMIWLTYEDEPGRNLKFAYRALTQLSSRVQQSSKDNSDQPVTPTSK